MHTKNNAVRENDKNRRHTLVTNTMSKTATKQFCRKTSIALLVSPSCVPITVSLAATRSLREVIHY